MIKNSPFFMLLSICLLGAGQSAAKAVDVDYGGSVLLDFDAFDGVYSTEVDASEDGSELRSAQLFLKLGLAKDWSSKLQLAYDDKNSRTEVKDAYILYKGWDVADIIVGQDKEPFSLDLMTSLKNSSAIERSLASNAFRLGRNLGVNFSAHSQDYSWSIGVYDVGEYGSDITQGGGGQLAVTGRFTLSPINSHGEVFHLGSSFSFRDLDGAEYEIESNAEVHSAADVLDTRNFRADSLDQFALESIWVKDRLALTAEAFYQDVTASISSDSAIYTGYYIEGSYFISNDSLRYNKGRFSSVKPNSESGAWQLVLRHSYLDAEDNLDGMEITNSLLGVNYYYRKAIKLMLNFTRTDLAGYDVESQDSGDAISFRAQYRF
jgi:phosphate-selective porin OprO and OprP